jgi:hypothetical protein
MIAAFTNMNKMVAKFRDFRMILMREFDDDLNSDPKSFKSEKSKWNGHKPKGNNSP